VTRVTPVEVTTDQAPVYPTLMEELLPAAWHRTDCDANNRVEADHGRLKARLRPMRGLKTDRSARVVIAGYAFVQNVRRGHYELAVDKPPNRRGGDCVRRARHSDLIKARVCHFNMLWVGRNAAVRLPGRSGGIAVRIGIGTAA
jgi:hypothetical protein